MDTNESLLRAILATVAHTAFPPAKICEIVAPNAGSDKQIVAYNLCDGKTTQAEIAKQAKLSKGHLSGAISRWLDAGIALRLGHDQNPMHLYPLTQGDIKNHRARKAK
ncbi:MAG: MarR family transcriptional regulator [Hyphomicrobiales bacterium]|nr:MarR family transcriptional regulator [Hyphomicrobiales bacterium]